MGKIVILVVLVYIGGIILSFVQGAHWAFYLYQIVYFLNPEHRWWSNSLPGFGYSKVTVIVLFLTYIINRKEFVRNNLSQNPQVKWLLILIVIYCVTYFFAVAPLLHEQAMIDFIKMLVVLSIAYKILDTKKKLEWSFLAYIAGSAYIGYEAFVTGRDWQGRVEGIGLIDAPEANGTAAAIVASLPLMIYFLWWGNNKIKLAVLLCGPVIVNGLILINSRGAFLGGIAGVGVFMWTMMFARLKTKNQRYVAIGLVVMGLSGTVSLIDETFLDRMTTLTKVEDERTSGSHRYRFWLATFDLVKDYPFGVGAQGYEILSQNYVPEEFFAHGVERKAVHSIWFQALAEVGWLGAVVFIALIVSSLRSLNRVRRKCIEDEDLSTFYLSQALFSAFIGLLITSSFINQFRVQIVYWCILFVSCLYSIVVINGVDDNRKL